MKIIAFEHSPTTALGGSERSYFDVLIGLRKKGHEVILYYNEPGDLVARYEEGGVVTRQVGISFMLRKNSQAGDFFRLLGFARREKPFPGQTVIYLNFAETLPAAALLRLVHGYRIVCHIRIGYFGLSRHILWAGRLAYRFIVINKKFRPVFEEAFNKKGKVAVVYNGLAIPSALQPPVVRTGGALRLLYLGRIAPEKGVIELVRALDLVRSRGIDVSLQITGDYIMSHSGDYRKELADAIDSASVRNLITFSPPVADPLSYMHGFDLLVFPSTWEEPFGRTVPEAILAGIPVLARNVGMIEEIMEDNTHFLFRSDEDLVNRLTMFAAGELNFDFEKARRRIMTHFNKDRMIDEVEGILRGD